MTEYSDADFQRLLAGPIERAATSAEDLAKVLGKFRRTLLDEGFDVGEAFDLCREFFFAMTDGPEERRDDDD